MDYVIEIMEASMASRAGELNALLAALSASAVPLTEQQWAAVIEARDTVTVVAKGARRASGRHGLDMSHPIAHRH